MSLPDQIPVFLLSGFLGSGKSTLLNELLADPAFHDTAVIINEFGDVPIDHLLVRQGETAVSRVSTGCLCCSSTTDLRSTLYDLHCAVSGGPAPAFSRVIVEMSGLGDPAPLVNALIAKQHDTDSLLDQTVDKLFYLAGFVTLYDIITGESSVEHHFEALKQVAFADRIVLTKTDLASDPSTFSNTSALSQELRALNTSAEIIDRQEANLATLFSSRSYSAIECGEDVAGWLALEAILASEPVRHDSNTQISGQRPRHAGGIHTFSITRDEPLPEKQFYQFISVLQNSAGQRLLRVKGIVAISEDPERPRIVHAVQHAMSDPVSLDRWPDDDRRTRLVFITSGVDPEPIHELFSAVIDREPLSFNRVFKRLGGVVGAPFSRVISQFTNIPRNLQ